MVVHESATSGFIPIATVLDLLTITIITKINALKDGWGCKINHVTLNTTRHFYFNRMVRLPYIDLQQPFNSIKRHILGIFWQVFIQQFDVNNSCTWFLSCPCTKCTSLPPRTMSFTTEIG